MNWIAAVAELRRTGHSGVLVTVVATRGHAPREAGAKMVVSATGTWGTIGGGNLEAVAIREARALGGTPQMVEVSLSDKAPYEFGVQCCGGQVTLLLEPLPAPATVAIFGMGHVGWELARILARHDLDLHLVDSREDQLVPERLAVLADPVARVVPHCVPVLPELVLAELPKGSHVVIMTHDHNEDAALCDAALRSDHLGSIGLIGSGPKWSNFTRKLAADGHSQEEIDRITSPIGLPGLTAKDPATIAVSVAADLLMTLERGASHTPTAETATTARSTRSARQAQTRRRTGA